MIREVVAQEREEQAEEVALLVTSVATDNEEKVQVLSDAVQLMTGSQHRGRAPQKGETTANPGNPANPASAVL